MSRKFFFVVPAMAIAPAASATEVRLTHGPAKVSEEAAAGILEFAKETEELLHGGRD